MLDYIFSVMVLVTYGFLGYKFYRKSHKQSPDNYELPEEPEKLLIELTDLLLQRAEILADIEDIQEGRYVQANIKREHGCSTVLSQESLMQALVADAHMLSEVIYEKSVEFAKSVDRCRIKGRINGRMNGELSAAEKREGSAAE